MSFIDSVITPFDLHVVLHYYACTDDYRWPQKPSFLEERLSCLCDRNLLEPFDGETAQYSITDRGRAYIEYLLAVKLPEMKWEVPT